MTQPSTQKSIGPRPRHSTRVRRCAGYILLETMVALVVLGAGSYAVHGTIRQAMITRAQAQDYTQARFLLEQVIGTVELPRRIRVETQSGRFEGDFSRFAWEYQVKTIDIPKPTGPRAVSGDSGRQRSSPAEYSVKFLVHIRATVSWVRMGQSFEESFETLFNPSKLLAEHDEEELGE